MKPFEVLILHSALQAGPPARGWGSQSREKAELELLTPSEAGSHPLGMRVHTVYQSERRGSPPVPQAQGTPTFLPDHDLKFPSFSLHCSVKRPAPCCLGVDHASPSWL